jgi:hypothetical protein
MAIVYCHKRKDTGVVFYIGIGLAIERAFQKKYRNQYWKNIVNLAGYDVEILKENISWDEACKLEKELIAKYKRKHEGGTLCNLTAGGDGVVGVSWTEEHKRKISESNKGKVRTDETKKKISDGRKGIVFSESHREKIRKNRTGMKMSEEFRKRRSELTSLGNHPKAKIVVDLQTGIFYPCLKEACIVNNCKYTKEVQRSKNKSRLSRFLYA